MGLLADLIGGAANTGHEMLTKSIANEEAEAAKVREEEREAVNVRNRVDLMTAAEQKRQSFLSELKATAARLKTKEDQQRLSGEAATVEEGAQALSLQRELSTAQQRAPSMDADVLAIVKDKLKPEQLEAIYGVRTASGVDQLDDRIRLARQHGFSDLEKSLITDRRGSLAEEVSHSKREVADTRLEQTAARDANRHAEAGARISAQLANSGLRTSPAVVRSYQFLESKGYTRPEIEAFLREKKLMAAGGKSDGEKKPRMTPEDVVRQAAHMDKDGNVRDIDGRVIYPSKKNPLTYAPSEPGSVEKFNAEKRAEQAREEKKSRAQLV